MTPSLPEALTPTETNETTSSSIFGTLGIQSAKPQSLPRRDKTEAEAVKEDLRSARVSDSLDTLRQGLESATEKSAEARAGSRPQSRAVQDALRMRETYLQRLASEDIYDVLRKDPATVLRHCPHLDPTAPARRIELMAKLDRVGPEGMTDGELREAHRLGALNIDTLLEETDEEEERLPAEYVALLEEVRTSLHGAPELDVCASLVKAKLVSDPRQFTAEDLERIAAWERSARTRELLACHIYPTNPLFALDEGTRESVRILKRTKSQVLADDEYQAAIALTQEEGDFLRRKAVKENARMRFSKGAADVPAFHEKSFGRVPRRGLYNLPSMAEKRQGAYSGFRRKNFEHFRKYETLSLKRA